MESKTVGQGQQIPYCSMNLGNDSSNLNTLANDNLTVVIANRLESLQESYSQWNTLNLQQKKSLLNQTVKVLTESTTQQIADFSLSSFFSEINLSEVRKKGRSLNIDEKINAIHDLIELRAARRNSEEIPDLNAFYRIGNTDNYFLVPGQAIASSATLQRLDNLRFNGFSRNSCNLEKRTFVLGLKILSQCGDIQDNTIRSQMKRAQVIELQKAANFFLFAPELVDKIEIQTNNYLIRKWKKVGVETSKPSEKMLLELVESRPIKDSEQLVAFLKLKKSLFQVDNPQLLNNALQKAIEEFFGNHPGGILKDHELELLNGYLGCESNQNDFKFDPQKVTFAKMEKYNFAHVLLMEHAYAKSLAEGCQDPILSLKASILRCLVHQNGNFDELKISFPNYSEDIQRKIFKTISKIFNYTSDHLGLRSQLLEIINLAFENERLAFLAEVMNSRQCVSKEDPLFVQCVKELKAQGFPQEIRKGIEKEIILATLKLCGIEETIALCQELLSHPENDICKRVPDLVDHVLTEMIFNDGIRLPKDEDYVALVKYALTIEPYPAYAWSLIVFIRYNISSKIDLSFLNKELEIFFDKIKNFKEAYAFVYYLCNQAVMSGNLDRAHQIASWKPQITNMDKMDLPDLSVLFK